MNDVAFDAAVREVAGHAVHCETWTPEVALDAPPLVLVHGLAGSTATWVLVGEELARTLGRRVHALDLAGFGLTPATERGAGIEVDTEILGGFLRSVGPSVVVGTSMGGAIAVRVAVTDRALVRALVLVNPAVPRPRGNRDGITRQLKLASTLAPRVAERLLERRARLLGPERFVDSALDVVLADATVLPDEVRQRLVTQTEIRHGQEESFPSYVQAAGSLYRYLATAATHDLDFVRQPTLLIHGTEDRMVPVSWARAVVSRRTDWTFREYTGCGHVPPLEQPERFIHDVAAFVHGT